MLDWLSGVLVAITAVTPVVTNTQADLQKVPNRPDQSQITCHDKAWVSKNLAPIQSVKLDKKLAPYITRLVSDAQATGYGFLITSGYRDCNEQANLRLQACGPDESKPADLCTPPTEPAGRSLHNEGLAIDLACQGYSVFEYSPCYTWLAKEAYKYQLARHHLEAWHWSTTGR